MSKQFLLKINNIKITSYLIIQLGSILKLKEANIVNERYLF